MAKKEKRKFEDSLAELETIVQKLEQGEVDLDESLKFFEQGVELYNFCKKELEQASKKIEILAKSLNEDEKRQMLGNE